MGGFGMLSRSRCVRRPLGGQIDSDNGRCSNSFEHHKKSSALLKDAEFFASTEPMRSIPSQGSRNSQLHPIDGAYIKNITARLARKTWRFLQVCSQPRLTPQTYARPTEVQWSPRQQVYG